MTGNPARIWRNYDQAALDEQMSLGRIADLEALFARRTQAAEAARGAFPCARLRYGPAERETLNLYTPAGAPPATGWPVMMFIHGGFWRSLDADLFSFLAPAFVPAGVALAAINYPLMPEARMEELVASCFAALRFLGREAGALGLDAKRLHVSGNSAGGHLVGELIDAVRLRARGFASDAIAGACAISGLYDLEPVRLIAMNEQIKLTRDEVKLFSPLRREYSPACPVIATVGGDETEEFLGQTREFAQLCTRAGAVVEHREEQGRDHITVVLDALGVPGHRLNRAVLRMMGVA